MKIENSRIKTTIETVKKQIQKIHVPPFLAHKESKKEIYIKHLPPVRPYEIEQKTLRNQEAYENFLYAKGRVTKEEYKYILKNYPFIISKCKSELQNNGILSQPISIACIGMNFKQYFDNTQKNPNGYRLISIGTSPAILCRALEILGCEVVYLPASGINRYRTFEELEKEKNTKKLLKYLQLKNVGKDEKTNIVIDLTSSGRTLSHMEKLVKKLSPNTVTFALTGYSISKVLDSIDSKNKPWKVNTIEEDDFFEDMESQRIEEITNVPHFCMWKNINKYDMGYIYSEGKTNKKLFAEFEEFSKPEARIFELILFHELDKLNKKNLETKHFKI